MSAEQDCQRLALSQYGAIGRTQATRQGLTRHQWQHLADSGSWEPALPGVLLLVGAPRSPRRDLMAACLWGGPGTAAVRRAAAGLWGLDGFAEGTVEIATRKCPSALPPGIIVHRLLAPPEMVTVRHGIPVTNRLITLLELGAEVSCGRVARALDGSLMRGEVSVTGLQWALDHYAGHGRRGAGTLRELLGVRTPGYVPPEGDLEPLLWEVIRTSNLPDPVRQLEIRDKAGRFLTRVDFAYPAIKLAIEADGYLFHARQEKWLQDRHRDNVMAGMGWHVLRYTWHDVSKEPDLILKEIAEFFFSS